ncbi:unnamed protein product [Adineta ricciae]|uniref:SAM domain-containing protein n=1 Tax=Adineta ricciae TaxID=249248 RepID=A0A814AS31_ADIRI|nr:unnamed protein product [Adineta ricciae]CAF0919064.1 unnamed protein product [Adineta ricciae]
MVGMKFIETYKCSNELNNRLHCAHHRHLHSHDELPLNVIFYCHVPKQTLIDTSQSIGQTSNPIADYERLSTADQTMNYHDQQATVANSIDFFSEINRFKDRLEVLERERFELEDKVHRLQAENRTYKTHFHDEANDWNGSRSITALNGHPTSMPVNENDIERLKRRIESLVKSNDDKERRIEDLQVKLTKCQTSLPLITIKKTDNSCNGYATPKLGYEADGDMSDSNSLPSINSDKDCQLSKRPSFVYNGYDAYPKQPMKLVLHRASSAEPMLNHEITPVRHMTKGTLPSSSKRSFSRHDHSGYISDGPYQKYSLSKKSSNTNLDRTKSSSMKGIKNLFGRIIRTNSGNIQEDDENLFHRGGCRGTMTSEKSLSSLESTFAHWQTEQIVNWLYGIGLGQYTTEFRKHFKNGSQLLHTSPQELEKKIGMRNPLHRKKLQLCLTGLCTRQTEAYSLDTYWVQKWLDDIGLPQYKEYFAESKVDGRILNSLTLEDIIYLNVTNELHHLSIKRSIQVLRLNEFNPTCMKRRPHPNDKNNINEIIYWSNHRVMEWLRSIDLAEYAPNLRGSGVCGALIILELRFNVSTLAEILSIPLSKTLLRRHLAMQFQELIGNDLQNRKNQYEKSPNCQPLTLHTKIRFPRGLFTHRRTRSVDTDELVCPMDENGIPNGISTKLKHSRRKETVMANALADEVGLFFRSALI